jgi:hypothetical protein
MNLHSVAQRIEQWLIDRLIPYARNPRTHSDTQVAQIAASITEFGFNMLLFSRKRPFYGPLTIHAPKMNYPTAPTKLILFDF